MDKYKNYLLTHSPKKGTISTNWYTMVDKFASHVCSRVRHW